MFSIPETLPRLLAENLPEYQMNAVTRAMASTEPVSAMLELSKYFRIKVTFKEPVDIVVMKRWKKGIKSHTFSRIAVGNSGSLVYCDRKTNHTGYFFPALDKVESFDVIAPIDDSFKSYEEFKAKFDPLFISDRMIQSLYNSTSAQTGEKYCKSDFKKLGTEGRRLLDRFLYHFKGLDQGVGTPGYSMHTFDGKEYWTLRDRHLSMSANANVGRDLTISHTAGNDRVSYASEYPGCANGDYGLIATKTTFLYLERD